MGRHRSTNEAVENARRLCQVTMIRFRHMSGHPKMSQIVWSYLIHRHVNQVCLVMTEYLCVYGYKIVLF